MSTDNLHPSAGQPTDFESAEVYKNLAGSPIEDEIPQTPEASDREPIETGLSEYFTSPEFSETITGFPDHLRDQAIGWSVEYAMVMNEARPKAVNAFLAEIQASEGLDSLQFQDIEERKTQIFIDQTAAKLGLSETESPESQAAIFAVIQENYHNGYYFHSFNSAFEDSILEHGINPHIRQWDQEDVREVSAIGKRVGTPMLLGLGDINSEGKISIANTPENIYRYAFASPEWFAQFTASGAHIPNSAPYDKTAYERKDYEAAKRNVELVCSQLSSRPQDKIDAGQPYPNLTEDETAAIMGLFEKYWATFSTEDNGPRLALIDRQAIDGTPSRPPLTYQEYTAYDKSLSFTDNVSSAIAGYNNDMRITHAISPDHIKIVELPSYESVHPSANP